MINYQKKPFSVFKAGQEANPPLLRHCLRYCSKIFTSIKAQAERAGFFPMSSLLWMAVLSKPGLRLKVSVPKVFLAAGEKPLVLINHMTTGSMFKDLGSSMSLLTLPRNPTVQPIWQNHWTFKQNQAPRTQEGQSNFSFHPGGV